MKPIQIFWHDPTTIRKRKWVRLQSVLPYGVWTCADGRQVMFNRQYHPMYERMKSGRATQADPSEWIENIKRHSYLYDDSAPLYLRMKLAAALLKKWRIA